MTLEIELLGVRGATPAPGPEFLRYGGHTSCIAIRAGGDPAPRLVLDAGTGIRALPGVFDGTILLTHLHWDHVQGLPFARALLDPAAHVRVLVPVEPRGDALATLREGFRPPSFPCTPEELGPRWSFGRLPGTLDFEPYRIRTAVVRHAGGRTVGVRVEAEGCSIAYLPDHDLSSPDPVARALAGGVDLLLHDAQHLGAESGTVRADGHSTIEEACRFADEAGVGRLMLVHHAPDRTDAELDRIAAGFQRTPERRPVLVAQQGLRLDVGSPALVFG
jgi:phosphoribosyl 1,2-cyclic phosphodiesterase